MRWLLVALPLLCCAACGGQSARISLRIEVDGARPQAFTLQCEPTGGTLPLKADVCRDLRQHEDAMLERRHSRVQCGGMPTGPKIRVQGRVRDKSVSFTGYADQCYDWAMQVYYDASGGNSDIWKPERHLRCVDLPLTASNAQVAACERAARRASGI